MSTKGNFLSNFGLGDIGHWLSNILNIFGRNDVVFSQKVNIHPEFHKDVDTMNSLLVPYFNAQIMHQSQMNN